MAISKPASDVTTKTKIKNLHVEVPEEFHTRVKMLCVIKMTSMKDYALSALEEKVARDEKNLAAENRSKQ
jgi:hypothetical protein